MDLSYTLFEGEYHPASWDEHFIRGVYWYSEKSKEPRTKIGAVIVRDNRPILWGFNGIPKGVKDLPERLVSPEKFEWMAHAEANACFQGSEQGVSSKDCVMYTQSMPCNHCAIAIIQCGIKEVVIHGRWMEYQYHFLSKKEKKSDFSPFEISKVMFEENGVKLKSFDKTLGTLGFMDGYIINV